MEANANTTAGHLLLVDLTPSDVPNPQHVAIAVSPERARYNAIRREYELRAARAEEAFSKAYDENLYDLDQLIEQVNELAADILVKELSQTVSDLVAMGAYSLSEATFLQEYGDEEMGWGQGYLGIADKYAAIVMSAEQLDAYRVNRRDGRGRAVAMGDSLGGLAKGYVMAAGVNLAVGALHRTFNGLGKIISAIGDSMKKSRIFNDPETKASLCADLYTAVFIQHYAFIDAANVVLNANITGMEEDEEVKEGLGLFSNIQKGRLPAEKVPELLSRSLTQAPYNKEIYDFVLQQYGDPTGSLEQAAAYFGIDMGAAKARLIEKEGGALLESQESWEARAQKLMALRKLAGSVDHPQLEQYRKALAEQVVEAQLADKALTHHERVQAVAALCELLEFDQAHVSRQQLNITLADGETNMLMREAGSLTARPDLTPSQRQAALEALAEKLSIDDESDIFRRASNSVIKEEKALLEAAAAKIGSGQEPLKERVALMEEICVHFELKPESTRYKQLIDSLHAGDKAATTERKEKFRENAIGIAVVVIGIAVYGHFSADAQNSASAPTTAAVATEAEAPAPEAEVPAPEAMAEPSTAPVITPSGVRDATGRAELQNTRFASGLGRPDYLYRNPQSL